VEKGKASVAAKEEEKDQMVLSVIQRNDKRETTSAT